MARVIIGLYGLAMVGMVALAACKVQDPNPRLDLPTDKQIADMVSMSAGGAPDQEIALDFYSTLTRQAKEYPALREPIQQALDDGKVTYMEYDRIELLDKPFEEAKGEKAWNAETAPYRKKLAEAANS